MYFFFVVNCTNVWQRKCLSYPHWLYVICVTSKQRCVIFEWDNTQKYKTQIYNKNVTFNCFIDTLYLQWNQIPEIWNYWKVSFFASVSQCSFVFLQCTMYKGCFCSLDFLNNPHNTLLLSCCSSIFVTQCPVAELL